MAFYSILQKPPYDIEVTDGDDGGRAVLVAVAMSDDETRLVSVTCDLVDAVIGGEFFAEFSFGISVISLDGSSEDFVTQDRNIAFPFIPDSIRAQIMDVVCEGLYSLIGDRDPNLVYFVAKDRDVPEKALPKYHLLVKTLEELGFSVREEGTDGFGRRFWTMEC